MKINSRIIILRVLAITKYGKKSSDTLQNILEDKHETFRMEQGKGVKDRLGDEVVSPYPSAILVLLKPENISS